MVAQGVPQGEEVNDKLKKKILLVESTSMSVAVRKKEIEYLGYECIVAIMNEIISSWTRDLPGLTSGRAIPSAVNRPLARRPHPILSSGGYSHGTGQTATSMFCARALQDSPLGRL